MTVYLLEQWDPTDPDNNWEIHGWTDDRQIAIAWRESSHRNERRRFSMLTKITEIK